MKQCTVCLQHLPLLEFSWKSKPKQLLQSSCKKCCGKSSAMSYSKNKRHYISKAIDRGKKKVIKTQAWIKGLNLKCQNCNESHPATLDFHHLDPSQKESNVSRMIHEGASISRITKEMSKCIVLCSNCHRKHHWNERQV